jgi:ABC-type Mn2+/Zn2+ transport system ATPase subunit
MIDTALSIENLVAGYNGLPVLLGVNLTLEKGNKYVLTGSNGSGKTTLLNTILGLHSFIGGTIRVLDLDIQELRRPAARRLCAYINQHMISSQLPVSAWEVASMGVAGTRLKRSDTERIVSNALEAAGAVHLKKKPYNELSGGQKQRIQIARCLAQGAELLFLDEPLASLDPESKVSVVSVLSSLRQTVLVVSHEHDRFDKKEWIFRILESGVIL